MLLRDINNPHAMPRQPRPDISGIAQHVVQRGNDRLPCFFTEADYRRYLINLREVAVKHDCAIHAYVLMTNHVHLLVTPNAAGSISRMMQSLGRRYVSYINTAHHRTGTLWEGRYKACLVDSERYVLACHRYIELNPVRAAMAATPEAYRWSSYHHNALGHDDSLLTLHSEYFALGTNIERRQRAYRALFENAISDERLAEIRAYLQQQRVLGTPRFQAHIEAMLGRRVTLQPRGRPKKSP
jgi:putative transposase